MFRHSLCAATVLSLLGCEDRPSPEPPQASSVTPNTLAQTQLTDTLAAQDAARLRFWSFAERLTLPRHTLSRVVGTASSTAFEPYANIHDSTLTDSLVTVFYPGLSFHYYRGREHEFLFSIMVTAPRDDLPLPIGIGSPDSLVLATFGRPSHQWPADDSTVLAFDVPQAEDGLISQLQFTVIHRTVSKITWFFPVD